MLANLESVPFTGYLRCGAMLCLTLLISGCSAGRVKTRNFCTPSGECFAVSKIAVAVSKRNGERILELDVVAPKTASGDQEAALGGKVFEGLAGFEAETLGLGRVIVSVNRRSPRWGVSTPVRYRASYARRKNGSWVRWDGKTGEVLPVAPVIYLQDGETLIQSARAIHKGRLFLVYSCDSCTGGDRIARAAGALFDVMRTVGEQSADARKLHKLHVTVFAGPRHSAWQFPQPLFISAKQSADGEWEGLADGDRPAFIAKIKAGLAKQRNRAHT